MKTGIELIAAERKRQIEVEGWTPEHDAQHTNGEIVENAIAAAGAVALRTSLIWTEFYEKVKTKAYKERLIIAGALIAAEIDRLQNI